MLVVGFIAFSLFNFVGDPVSLMLPPEATQADRDAMRGIARPRQALLRAVRRRSSTTRVHGNFGISLRLGRPVSTLLVERLPATLELAIDRGAPRPRRRHSAGRLHGAASATRGPRRRSSPRPSSACRCPTSSSASSSSSSSRCGWGGCRPSGAATRCRSARGARGSLTKSGLKALILPSITLGFFPLTLIMRLVRAEMLEVLRTDYIKFARARGLTDRAVNFGHALKNTLVPVITITGLQLGGIIAFAIITEQVFQWPGMGLLFIQAVQFADIPVMAAYLVPHRAHLRGDQPRGGHALLRRGSAPARRARQRRRGPLMDAVRRFFDSDVFYSFKHSPLTIVAAADPAGLHLRRGLRAVGRAAQSVRPEDAEPPRRLHAARLHRAAATRKYLLGTDDQGRDVLSAIIFGSRMSLMIGLFATLLAMVVRRLHGPHQRLRRRQDRRLHHARGRRPALVPGDPHRAPHRRRGARGAAARAPTTSSRSTC